MVDALLRQNRCGQQPKWTQLGISLPKDPLHLKNVSALLLDELDRMALALKDPDLQARWFKVKKWITVPQPGLPRGRAVDAELTEDELRMMIDVGQAEGTTVQEVRSTCNIFPVSEYLKRRRRVIKHTKCFNDTFGKDTLAGVRLLRTRDLVKSVHDGTYVIQLDFSAWFDQFELDNGVRPDFCFPAFGKWYRLTRLPMGMRQAVDVAQTATEILCDFEHPASVRIDAYVDNVRFLGCSRDEVIATAAKFIARCRDANATINEVDDLETPTEAATRLVATEGEFLGAHFDYVTKMVRVGDKSIAKLSIMQDLFSNSSDSFTFRNFLTTFGLIFFALQVTRAPAADRYYALKEYSEVSRRLQRDPGLLETVYKCSPSRYQHVSKWIQDTIENVPRAVPLVPHPADADFILVTDASAWGWGAILLNADGEMVTWSERWARDWEGAKRSAWSEPQAIAHALRHFFPNGTTQSVAVLSDSSTAVGAFAKGRSKAYAVNRSILAVQDTFPHPFNASWWHIAGWDNPTDSISRGLVLGDKDMATAHVRRLAMGFPREGVPMLSVIKENAKVREYPLCKDINTSNAASNVSMIGDIQHVGVSATHLCVT